MRNQRASSQIEANRASTGTMEKRAAISARAFGMTKFRRPYFQHRWFHPSLSTLLVLIAICGTACFAETKVSHMAKLRKDILGEGKIDRHSRPVQSQNETVVVELIFDIAHIHSLDEWTGTLTVNGWMKLSWEDKTLQWKSEEYGGLDHLMVPHNTIWQPDVTLYNSAQASDMDHYGNSNLFLTDDGMVHWFPPVTFHTTCSIDHKLFPFDEHSCSIVLGSWTYDVASVSLQLSEEHNSTEVNTLEYYTDNPQWELLSIKGSMKEISYECCEDSYRMVEYKLLLRRRSPFYHFTVVLPAVVAMCITLVLFWLPPRAGEKMTLGAVALLLQTALLFFLGWCVPPGGKSIPAIVLFCANSLVMSGLSLLISVAVMNLSRRIPQTTTASSFRSLLLGPIKSALCLSSPMYQATSMKLLDDNNLEMGDTGNHVTGNTNHDSEKSKTSYDWLLLATAIDRICFVVYCLTFVAILISSFAK